LFSSIFSIVWAKDIISTIEKTLPKFSKRYTVQVWPPPFLPSSPPPFFSPSRSIGEDLHINGLYDGGCEEDGIAMGCFRVTDIKMSFSRKGLFFSLPPSPFFSFFPTWRTFAMIEDKDSGEPGRVECGWFPKLPVESRLFSFSFPFLHRRLS